MVLNRARRRSALAAVLALAASPNGFTVTGFAEQVRVMTGQSSRLQHPARFLRPA